jgi:hypothetical protein
MTIGLGLARIGSHPGSSLCEKLTEAAKNRPRFPRIGISSDRLASDLSALQQGIDIARSLALFEAVLGDDLANEVILRLEGGKILLGEFVPLRADLLKDDLPSLFGGCWCRGGIRSGCVGSSAGHRKNLQRKNKNIF